MGAKLFEWMLGYRDLNYQSAASGLSQRFGASPNIEDVISELQAKIKSLDTDNLEDRLERAQLANWRGYLGSAVRQWFLEIHNHPASGYEIFANQVVHPDDVVLTFNYDDSLERELRRAGKWSIHGGYGFPVGDGEQQSPTLVLKLHGSINWVASIFKGRTSGMTLVGSDLSLDVAPLLPEADLEYLGYGALPGHHFPGGGSFPALIMPGRKKEFFFETSFGKEWTEFWCQLWTNARGALTRCEKLVLCGYNLLPIDERACDLILDVPSRDVPVIVVSGDQSDRIARAFQQKGFSNIRSEENRFFEDWVKATGL